MDQDRCADEEVYLFVIFVFPVTVIFCYAKLRTDHLGANFGEVPRP